MVKPGFNGGKPGVIDLFCGCGGLSLGFEMAGYDILLATDIDGNCERTYKENYSHIPFIRRDIGDLSVERIREITGGKKVDVLLGGPPCQGFSTIGNRASSSPEKRNRHDPRNELFEEYVRILKGIRPSYFVMENVKGLLTLHGGEFFKNMLGEFKRAGYKNLDYKVLNAADYGVPQIRYRVFFIGNRLGKKITFPGPTHAPPEHANNGKEPYRIVEEAIGDLGENYKVPNHIPLCHGKINLARYSLIPEGGRMPECKLPPELYRKNFGNTFKRLHRKKPALTMVPGHNAFPVHPTLNRTLTPREAARIQTFPDNIIFHGTRQAQCKQVGNAIPPLLAMKIGLHIKEDVLGCETLGDT